jgi:DNA-binding NtrC family response regulator
VNSKAQEIPTRAPGSGNITVLAVSPSQDDLLSLRDILESERWTVRTVKSYREAAHAMQNETPAVVTCENELPDGDWKDLFRLAISMQEPPPVVVVARNADESLWAEVLNLGGYDVLAKPFERLEVSRVVRMACRHGRRSPSSLT